MCRAAVRSVVQNLRSRSAPAFRQGALEATHRADVRHERYDRLTSMEVMDMEATRDELLSEFKGLIGDAEALLKATTDQAGETVTAVRQRIEQRLEEGKKSVAEAEVLLFEKTKEAARNAEVYVRENPWNAVGIAAGVGLVVGLLMRRR